MVVAVSRQDRVYKDYTSNPIPTSFFFQVQPFPVISYVYTVVSWTKKDVGMGLLV